MIRGESQKSDSVSAESKIRMAAGMTDDQLQKVVDDYKEKARVNFDHQSKQLENRFSGSFNIDCTL